MSNNRIVWLNPADRPDAFPPIETALSDPDGLLAAGGDLSEERLLHAYRRGIFPWFDEGQPILWWSPDPRCVLNPRDFHIANRLRRQLSRSTLSISINRHFDDVIRACAAPRRSEQGTWITDDMMRAYQRLHASGWAHSLEVLRDGNLVGGIYGLAIGKVFFGESMFSGETNASKIALLALCQILVANDFELIDCQVVSGHLLTLGARTIPRSDFANSLEFACEPPVPFNYWPEDPFRVSDLRTD